MSTQDRPSSIPRISRLPRPVVSIPKLPPTPSPTSPCLKFKSSRDSLSGIVTPTSDVQSPKLRSPVSRGSLRSSSGGNAVKPFVRHCASKEQMRPGAARTGCCRHAAAAAATVTAKPAKAPSASRRWSTITHNPTSQYKPWAEPRPDDSDRDDFIRQSVPSGGMPELLLSSYLNGTLGSSRNSDSGETVSASSDGILSDVSEVRSKHSGDSHHHGPASAAEGTSSSRPGSSNNSEPSSGLFSPSQPRDTASRASLSSSRFYSTPMVPEARCPSPVKRPCGAVHGMTMTRSGSVGKAKPKPGRPFKKASLSSLVTSESESGGAPSAGWDGSIRPILPALESDDEPAFRKSSMSLRDHIARAKAAKRAAMRSAGGDDVSSVGYDTVGISTATGLDDSVYDDALGAIRGGNKMLKHRVSAARTSGRLNIAALGLKEIPSEVLKMYDYESIQEPGGSWAESVDLKRFIAADNELERLDDAVFPDRDPGGSGDEAEDDAPGNIFGGLETIDLHGNQLVSVPVGLRRLAHLTSLNVSSNRLDNDSLNVISQITSLRDLKLAKNCLAGPLDASLARLHLLETLDIHGNHVSALPAEVQSLTRLRILNLSENNFESISFDSLAKLPLTELDLKRNKLSGTLIEDPIEALLQLQTFDVSSNRLTRLVPEGSSISLPVVHTLLLSMNRLQELPDMSTWTNLLTLTADTNNITVIPESFSRLSKLRQADFSGNDLKMVPPEIGLMEDLTMLRLSGNPLREKKFASSSTDAIKAILAGRLEAPAPVSDKVVRPEVQADLNKEETQERQDGDDKSDERQNSDDKPDEETRCSTTPPDPALPSPPVSESSPASEPSWQVKAGGLLDQSRSESTTLDAESCARVAAEHSVQSAQLHHNLYTCIPGALSVFGDTLTSLALGHNQMTGEAYLTAELRLPVLTELNLASNHITSLGPLMEFLDAPCLEKLDVSMNRLGALPMGLRQRFPKLAVLLAANNHLVELDPSCIRGLQVVDVSSNDIAHLDPRIGLLGGLNGLQRLEVTGNRFRVPRWTVLERGTETTMRWLRGRVPAADMVAWKAENGDDVVDEDDSLGERDGRAMLCMTDAI